MQALTSSNMNSLKLHHAAKDRYKLTDAGFQGTTTNPMTVHNGMNFTTRDGIVVTALVGVIHLLEDGSIITVHLCHLRYFTIMHLQSTSMKKCRLTESILLIVNHVAI